MSRKAAVARARERRPADTVPDTPAARNALRDPDASALLLGLLVASLVLLGLRLYAATVVGFGDSEALYASYAAHPQPAYLDHPGLVGVIASALGGGAVPTPLRVHVLTSFVSTVVPWLAYATARQLGASRGRAAAAGLVLLVAPETAVGLFGLTPDLILAVTWLGTLLLAGVGLRAAPGSTRAAAALLGAGLLAGVSCAAKVSGLLLVAALVVTYGVLARGRSDDDSRANARAPWPWAGLVAGLLVLVPIVRYEAMAGWPMLVHRLVDTQHGAGLALRNLGALLGGQLAYASPVLAVLAVIVARDLWRTRRADAVSWLLFCAFAVPLVPLVLLCLWSRVAEPHWLAPALLALPIHAARRATAGAPLVSARLFRVAVGVGAAITAVAYAWVLVPASAKLLPASADPRVDIASELYGWPTVAVATRETMKGAATPFDPEGREVVIVGPHWTVCAQLAAALPGTRVGCATPVRDDFDDWTPREDWRRAEHVVFVTDNRYPGDGAAELPLHVQSGRSRVRVLRGGRTARVFELYLYERRGQASR
ncbi:MAG: hypothetical protein JWP97_4856 [Labilithrix sp.]|nr:hypothetical protein [Labilithrix sp.]